MALPSVVDEIDRLFDELVRRPWTPMPPVSPITVRTVDDGWVIEVPVDGLQAADIEVQLQGRQLTVTGARRTEREERREGRTTARTLQSMSLFRAMTLPMDTSPEDIEARVEGTTLFIHVRKREPWRKLIKPKSA